MKELLEYAQWRNFEKTIEKAKISCENNGIIVADHFADVSKMVEIGSKAQRKLDDYMLTRYACYLIAENGDPRKEQIAFAQSYFAVQTRKQELIEERIRNIPCYKCNECDEIFYTGDVVRSLSDTERKESFVCE